MSVEALGDMDMQRLAQRLKTAREAAGLTQTTLAERCDFNLPTLNTLERGQGKGLRALTLYRLAQALDVSLDYLVGLTDDPRSGARRKSKTKTDKARVA